MTTWYDSIMESLQGKYKFPAPTGIKEVEIAFGAQFTDYWSADTAAMTVKNALEARAARDGMERKPRRDDHMGTEGWTDSDTFKLADMAFHLSRVIKDWDITNYDGLVQAYANSVANSSAPDFFDRIPEFQAMAFTTTDGKPVTGKELLAEAAKRRRTPPSTGQQQSPGF